MTRCFKWLAILLVYLSLLTSLTEVIASNSPIINEKVITALTTEYAVPVLIKLRDEADDPSISRMATASDPARFISKEHINRLQSQFEVAIARDGLQDDVVIIHQLENIPWITGTITKKALEQLQTNPNVAMVIEDGLVEAFLGESGPLINSLDAHALGYTGSGVNVAVLDTGIDTDHPNLMDDLIWEECFMQTTDPRIGECPSGGTRESGPGSAEDDLDHGTHVSGIITSSDSVYKGIAPDAGIIAIKVLDSNGLGADSDIIAGIDWVTSHRNTYNIKIINMSLGGDPFSSGYCDGSEPAFAAACNAAKNAGITVFAASGNDAFPTLIASPACLSSVISVGAVYDADLEVGLDWGVCTDFTIQEDQIVCFSDASTVLDLLAPGSIITSTTIGGKFEDMSGTSMASPHAAAVAALILQKDPSLTPDQVKDIMKCTDASIYDSRNDMLFPRVNALAAVQAPAEPEDNDEDGYFAPPCGNDCDDNDPDINPGAGEICDDGVDNDCDGLVDCDDPNCCCDIVDTPISTGDTVSESLSNEDCQSTVRGGSYYADRYSFDASAGQEVAISLMSSDFDTYLYLIGPNGSVVTEDDDGGEGLNSLIPPENGYYTLPSDGTYIIEVTSWGANNTGEYTLILSGKEHCSNGTDDDGDGLVDCNDPDCCCKETPEIGFGETAIEALSTDDCRSQARDGTFYADRYSFDALGGQMVAISLTSADFDPYLLLIDPDGSVVAEDDDGGEGNNSRIPPSSGFYTLSASGTYTIEVTSWGTNKTGSYTLSLSGKELCANGVDDDGDSFVDCDDSDCPCQCTATSYSEGASFVKFNHRKESRDNALFFMCANQVFCNALHENPNDIVVRLDDCDAVVIPESIIVSNSSKTKFRARASTYRLKVDCEGAWLRFRIKNVDLDEGCFSNPIKMCVSIKDGPCICTEADFEEVLNKRGKLKKATLTVTEVCTLK